MTSFIHSNGNKCLAAIYRQLPIFFWQNLFNILKGKEKLKKN
ncbi:hypothetical protein Mgra_00007442 [Meloidogyne graminicola]|uniref:Uncharacterized protein n=1 Tax=Meloidogyne graminicola TaxID=189291 RepID=A0A8S9ZIW9_9BILA|nr:hypothetical protein Mgra_00007442 [Meloidogyne graminicola]